MEGFAEMYNGFKPFTVLAKLSIVDFWQGSKYAYE